MKKEFQSENSFSDFHSYGEREMKGAQLRAEPIRQIETPTLTRMWNVGRRSSLNQSIVLNKTF